MILESSPTNRLCFSLKKRSKKLIYDKYRSPLIKGTVIFVSWNTVFLEYIFTLSGLDWLVRTLRTHYTHYKRGPRQTESQADWERHVDTTRAGDKQPTLTEESSAWCSHYLQSHSELWIKELQEKFLRLFIKVQIFTTKVDAKFHTIIHWKWKELA